MDQFIQQFATGLSTGSLYAIIALALVLIYRSTGVVNFAQGEMAMFMTFIAWSLYNGIPSSGSPSSSPSSSPPLLELC